MHRTDGAGHVGNLFSDGTPSLGVLGTQVEEDWLNAVQEELCYVIEQCGGTLVKGTNTQLLAACVATATANKIVRRDASGRAAFADPSAAGDAATKGYVDARGWQRAVAASDTTCSSSTTGVDVSGLAFAVVSGHKYLLRARLIVATDLTSVGLSVWPKATGAPSTSTLWIEARHRNTGGTESVAFGTAFADAKTPFADCEGMVQFDLLDAYFVATSAGTFQLRLLSETSGTVYVLAGSWLEWLDLGT